MLVSSEGRQGHLCNGIQGTGKAWDLLGASKGDIWDEEPLLAMEFLTKLFKLMS